MNHPKMTFEEYPQLSSLHNHQMARTHPLMKLNKKSLKKLGDKMYLKDTKTFKIEFNKNFIFYYGFQK